MQDSIGPRVEAGHHGSYPIASPLQDSAAAVGRAGGPESLTTCVRVPVQSNTRRSSGIRRGGAAARTFLAGLQPILGRQAPERSLPPTAAADGLIPEGRRARRRGLLLVGPGRYPLSDMALRRGRRAGPGTHSARPRHRPAPNSDPPACFAQFARLISIGWRVAPARRQPERVSLFYAPTRGRLAPVWERPGQFPWNWRGEPCVVEDSVTGWSSCWRWLPSG